MATKVRPLVDPRSYNAAEDLLTTSDKFNALRADIQEDCKWELADRIQRAWEDYCEEQKLDD